MEIQTTGLASRELAPNKASIEQQLTAQRAQEKDENGQQAPRELEPKPVEQAGADKLGRIDIYV